MNELDQMHSRFLQEFPNQSDEGWQALRGQVEGLARQASKAAIEGLLGELSSLTQKASARGEISEVGLLDLPTILAWRLSVYFRNAAMAIEETRRPESMEAGWDEEMDQYRELWRD
jgi:hypothetical protein